MAEIVLLGTGYAVPEEGHDNTHLFFKHGSYGVLVDTGTNPLHNLRRAGITLDSITDLILTHFHPDHASGVPMLLMAMWLLGRKAPLTLHGIPHTLERAQALMEMFDWKTWPNFFPTRFNALPITPFSPIIEVTELRVVASPVMHLIPAIGLRIEWLAEGKAAAYSTDTEPCQAVVELARGADVLIHESAGPSIGHTGPAQAGAIARDAGVKSLYLIHTPPNRDLYPSMVEQAARSFAGKVQVAQDGMVIRF